MADPPTNKGPPTGALNVERRTWDLEHFEKVAKERLEQVRPSPSRPFHLNPPTSIHPHSIHRTTQQNSGEEQKKKPGFVRKREEFQSADEGRAGPEGRYVYPTHPSTHPPIDARYPTACARDPPPPLPPPAQLSPTNKTTANVPTSSTVRPTSAWPTRWARSRWSPAPRRPTNKAVRVSHPPTHPPTHVQQ